MNDPKFDAAIARLQQNNIRLDIIVLLIAAPFAASAYASLWSFAWRLIP
jgi:hypothetical protein